MSVKIYIPVDSAALSVGAERVADAIAARGASARPRSSRSCATVRAACSGWSRWSKWRPAQGRLAYGPIEAERRRLAVRCGLHRRRRPSQGARPDRGHPLSARTSNACCSRAAESLEPLSIEDYRAHGGLKGLDARPRNRPEGDRRGGSRLGPARARRRGLSRPESNGAPSPASRRTRNMSSATPTKATAAHSPTAC